jgi:hypothetical protein
MLASSVLLDQTYLWPLYEGAEHILSRHWILVSAGRCAYPLSPATDRVAVAHFNAKEDRNHLIVLDRVLVRLHVLLACHVLANMVYFPVCIFSIFRPVALRHFQTEDLTGWFSIYTTRKEGMMY